jgi:DNA-binding winged helix-turn-helix (wHTH) protein
MLILDLKNDYLITNASDDVSFEFDYLRNVILFGDQTIRLSPHEADILRVLLNHRARPTPIDALIPMVYGAREPDSAAASIRVAIHSLRKKIGPTGMTIKVTPGLGYEIDTTALPEVNHRLTDKILLALNHARASGERDIVKHLQAAMSVAEGHRQTWNGAANAPHSTMVLQ